MNSIFKLEEIVKREMGDIISSYHLTIHAVSDSEVLLKSREYAIDVVADRDGVSLVYFDKRAKSIKGYNIFRFLVDKRRNQLDFAKNQPPTHSYPEFIELQTRSLANHLRKAAQDILSGSTEWIKAYSWPTLPPANEIAPLI
ncbi:hypothetical protein FBZ89_103293 [Nitrospirillum amazonense]|uniref:Uncharacterized protein n=1 Tax=Nitrospirillum amazonense TaxID=28077 RepID=A0A560FM38_9PROT|nr:hypothetical protein [Nitrospirillum amazonense]TWB22667.1 hypothetical protein FBZ89_103293 [Nitrospirillum amazonense]